MQAHPHLGVAEHEPDELTEVVARLLGGEARLLTREHLHAGQRDGARVLTAYGHAALDHVAQEGAAVLDEHVLQAGADPPAPG